MKVQRSNLVCQYLGSTTRKMRDVVEAAYCGVVFIDEAYHLIPSSLGGKDFRHEVVEELMSVMETGDPVKIFAGHEKKMQEFLLVNPGLRSHVYRYFILPHYTVQELGQMFCMKERAMGFQQPGVGGTYPRRTKK